MTNKAGEITNLLSQIRQGDYAANDKLIKEIFQDLRQLAAQHLAHERDGHTLQPTALVNEVYLRIFGNDQRWENRTHFFAVAATAIRRILVDHARHRNRLKRGGHFERMELHSNMADNSRHSLDLLALDDAIKTLESLHPRQAKVVEQRFFGGLNMSEISESLGVSLRTVETDWKVARLWLSRQLKEESDESGKA